MADRIFERILNQTAADVEAQQEQADPEARRRKAQVGSDLGGWETCTRICVAHTVSCSS